MGFFKRRKPTNEDNFDDVPPIGGLLVSKMVVDENIKPRFMYREKPTRPEDSGWRIFTGLESDEYTNDANNIGIYNPSTILKIDSSIRKLLLKGIGSVFERSIDDNQWEKVTDFEMQDDYMVTYRLTEKWTIKINNLFERIKEEDGSLLYTTGDKSVRLTILNAKNEDKAELYRQYQKTIEHRDQRLSKTLEKFEFSDPEVSRIGYLIKENDGSKSYDVIYGFSIIDYQVILVALYFDEPEDKNWAIDTWKNITLQG